MALDPHYITDGPLEEAFLDKDTGLPLAGGTITFYRDASRITSKPVYQLTGAPPNYQYIPLDNPLTLSSIGTVQNAGGDNEVIYYYPYDDNGSAIDLYYVVVKDSNGVEQFTREAWPNGVIADESISNINSLPVQNQVSNPQFTKILINDVPTLTPSVTTYTVTAGPDQVFEFAPNWNFLLSGTGNVTVERIAVAGDLKIATSPPYVIEITVDPTISSCKLLQKFANNSGLWSTTSENTIFLSTNLVAKNMLVLDTSVKMYYQASSGSESTVPIKIFEKNIPGLADYALYSSGSTSAIPESDNALSGANGFINIYISLQPSAKVRLSSVQVIPTFNAIAADIVQYDETSSDRDQALMGDYYIPRTIISPLPSLLTAWDFPLNPAQFGETVATIAATPDYTWDQTICCRNVGNVAVARNSITNAMQFTPASDNDSVYLMQFLTGAQAKEMLFSRLSVNIAAYLAANVGVTTVRAYLLVGTAASVVPIIPATLGSLSATGEFTGPAAGWSFIPRSGLDTPRDIVTANNPTTDNDIQFSGWEVVDGAQFNDTNKFAIVVTFAWTTKPVLNVLSISLNKGDLPTRPSAQTPSDVLSECQYYYEKSYNAGAKAGDVSLSGALCAQQGAHPTSNGSDADIATRTFGFTYNVPKRTTPTVVLYSPASGAAANVYYTFSWKGVIPGGYPVDKPLQAGLTPNIIGWVQLNNGHFGVTYRSNSEIVIGTASNVQDGTEESYINFHYSADCRLGIIA
jgi:hypothetical protein